VVEFHADDGDGDRRVRGGVGVFRWDIQGVIPDNMSSVVDEADATEPRFNQAFIEYAQSRGFIVDPARVRTPTDKPRVERTVHFVRNSFFAGEDFIDLADAQRRAELWCAGRAGLRTHGTTQCRPAEHFALEERPHLLAAPTAAYDVPVYVTAKVHRDHHIEVAKAIYSIPGDLIGCRVEVRADRQVVRVTYRGAVIKVHPRTVAGGRVTDPADLPSERTVYALRDLNALQRMAAKEGPVIGAYAAAVLDHPLPWTKMRQVYALLGLVKRWGPGPVEAACERALEAEAVSVALIGRMIERATETAARDDAAPPPAVPRDRPRPDGQPGTQGPATPRQAGPHPRHPARASRVGQGSQSRPRRVLGTGPVRRSHTPRHLLG
jgi:hypothetical protein